ncbi:MAG: hypothetical protein DMF75_08600 [Acidobacteria bacterium]|nr:MAG: hypothetical protein DMF75_08600 [Acidobacteriota bacterium]
MSSPKLQFAFFNLHFSIFNAFPCPPLPSNHWHSIGAPHPKPFARDSHLRTSPRHWRRFRHARALFGSNVDRVLRQAPCPDWLRARSSMPKRSQSS